ncbi:MAG TPA: hypothetical protein VGS62_11250 [Streptosporangiaceae bacterium]|nr:hypothetical protein [Streptosporangiaceae bacterium]
MTDTKTITEEIQGQVLETIRKSQEAVVDAVRKWSDSVQSVTPSLPVPALPFADKLPSPADVVANAYDFAGQLLAAQRQFAEDVIEAAAPALTATGGAPAAKKATPAAK